jgi:hypothetical protein
MHGETGRYESSSRWPETNTCRRRSCGHLRQLRRAALRAAISELNSDGALLKFDEIAKGTVGIVSGQK